MNQQGEEGFLGRFRCNARYLTDDVAVAEYVTAVLERVTPTCCYSRCPTSHGPEGMSLVAKEAGLGRESLYKALAPGSKPRFDTILKVAKALGVRLTAQPGLPTDGGAQAAISIATD
jgi:probable addiction module antidote protein